MAARTLYYFAVGGTGALSVEPLLHCCAAGQGPERLSIILIDPDGGNPAITRALELIEGYSAVRRACGEPKAGFFSTDLIRTSKTESVWSPLTVDGGGGGLGSLTLESHVEKTRMAGECAPAGRMLDLLFSAEQQKEQLKEGFRSNPAIGSVLMHGLRSSRVFKDLLNAALNDVDSRFFAAGSIFGGTGAAALPVLARILADEGVQSGRIGGALITPYYALPEPSAEEKRDGRLKPDSARFLLAAAAALPTYTAGHTAYGGLYVIGDEQSLSKPRKTYCAGGKDQLNDPHFIELFTAMAAIDFVNSAEPKDLKMRYATLDGFEPGWDDLILPDRRQLLAFIIASNFFLQYFGVGRTAEQEQRIADELSKMPWLQSIGLNRNFVRQEAVALNYIGDYMANFWAYLAAVTNNYRPLRLVSFAVPSSTSVAMPATYASRHDGQVRIPRVDRCLEGHNVRRRGGLLRRGDADSLETLANMFHWYNAVNADRRNGIPGLMHYMLDGSKGFAEDWYSRTTAEVAST